MDKELRLDTALVARGLCQTRTEAQELIGKGLVFLNEEPAFKSSKAVREGDSLRVEGRRRFVSRGGEKLEGVLMDVYGSKENIETHIKGKEALDVGSSTGGFTDCLLMYSAGHVHAVDVGSFQLHDSLRRNEKISLYENEDIRTFSPGKKYEIVVADVSFISMKEIISSVIGFGKENASYFILVKPQFEVGKGNTKKGVVKDEALAKNSVDAVIKEAKGVCAFSKMEVYPSKLKGGDGNQEYFIYLKK